MNGLDLLLVALAAIAAVGGWRLGFLRRFSGWLGIAAGVSVAIVVTPSLVRRLDLSSDLAVVLIVTAVLVLLATAGNAIGSAIGSRLRREVDSTAVRQVDAVGGMVLGILAVCVLAWLILPVMADAEGWPAASTRGSLLAGLVDQYLPEPPPQVQELERQLAGGGYPQLFADLRAAPDIPDAPVGSPVDQEVLDAAAPSAVRLQSEACDQLQSGSGFFVGEQLIATNAHVVAGARQVQVTAADGVRSAAEVVAFDPSADLALLRTDLDREALRLAPPELGDQGLVLGFPGGGPFDPSPFEIGDILRARGYDIYDTATVDRELLALAAALAPGDSGSAVLRSDGTGVGVAVAVAPDQPQVAYALDSSELRQLLSAPTDAAVSTGRCTF